MNIIPVEYNNQRILTTQQIAESCETDTKHINNNFQNNRDRYTLGKHYFVLEGEELRNFKTNYLQNLGEAPQGSPKFAGNLEFENSLKFAPVVYLWTKKGAFLHAKSLNTDKAWEVYEKLIDGYFEYQEMLTQSTQPVTQEQIAHLQGQIDQLKQSPSRPKQIGPIDQAAREEACKKRCMQIITARAKVSRYEKAKWISPAQLRSFTYREPNRCNSRGHYRLK